MADPDAFEKQFQLMQELRQAGQDVNAQIAEVSANGVRSLQRGSNAHHLATRKCELTWISYGQEKTRHKGLLDEEETRHLSAMQEFHAKLVQIQEQQMVW